MMSLAPGNTPGKRPHHRTGKKRGTGKKREAARTSGDSTFDAVGPETYSFNALVRLRVETVQSKAAIMHIPPRMALVAAKAIGLIVGDVLLTGDEVKGLMANLLVSDGPPRGRTSLAKWLADKAGWVGMNYSSEVARHYR